MDIDLHLSNWLLEFVLRQPFEDRIMNALIETLPFPANNLNLQKQILLKKMESKVLNNTSISKSFLDLFDLLEETEFRLGHGRGTVSDAMKVAYCAVAVKFTVKQLGSDNDLENDSEESRKFRFFEAVKEIWKGRIGRMVEVLGNRGGLVSEELLVWKGEMEAAVWDDSLCGGLVEKSGSVDAVGAIGRFLREEKEKVGPSFLEVVAERMKADRVLQELLIPRCSGNRRNADGEVNKVREAMNDPKNSAGIVRTVTGVDGASQAHTFEGGESLDGSSKDLPSRSGSPRPPSQTRVVEVSPLNECQTQMCYARRKRKMWSVLEEDTLRAGVREYGKGNWKIILTSYADIFKDRTDVDLKDKWRNLTR